MSLLLQVLELAKGNKSFAAIDRAIGKDSFKVVLLLRLSPLLPLAASNYLYGLTSVALVPYILGSWLGMLPGTLAYVSAGEDSMFRSCHCMVLLSTKSEWPLNPIHSLPYALESKF